MFTCALPCFIVFFYAFLLWPLLLCLSFALLFLFLLFQPFLLFFLQFFQSLLPFFLLLHYFSYPPLVLFPRQYLLEFNCRLVLLLALLIFPSNLVVQILYFFGDILSFGLDLDFLLLLVGELGRSHCLFGQGSCSLNDKECTSGMTKDPFSKLIAIFSIELRPCF